MNGETLQPAEMFNDLAQIGVVVRDLDRSITFLSEVFGLGPFRIIEYPPKDRTDMQRFYRGRPGSFRARLAFVNLGPLELELIQPLEGESIWQDFLDTHGEGIHHVRFNVADLPAALQYLAGKGVMVTQSGTALRPGTSFHYLGTETTVGFVIELLNKLPGTNGRTPVGVDGKIHV